MKVFLSIPERNNLSAMLAEHKDSMGGTLRAVREAREEIDFSDLELESWTAPCSATKTCSRYPEKCRHRDREFTFPRVLVKLIGQKLRELNEKKQLVAGLWSLVEKFEPSLLPEADAEEPEPAANGEVAKV